MRKLRLDIHALRVESFAAAAERGPDIGTVRANALASGASCNVTECQDTCLCPNTSPQPSCDACSWEDCTREGCITLQVTCYCPHTSPNPSCDDCSWDGCAAA